MKKLYGKPLKEAIEEILLRKDELLKKDITLEIHRRKSRGVTHFLPIELSKKPKN